MVLRLRQWMYLRITRGLGGVVEVVGAGQREVSERPELRLDPVQPEA